MNKTNRILTAILIAQLALAAFLLWPRSAPAGGGPLLPDLKAEEVTAVTVQDRDGNRIRLARQGDGWVLPEADDFPALSDRVNQLLEKLTKLNTARLVAQTPDSHRRLQVAGDDFQRRIELETKDGRRWVVYLGSSPQPAAIHVRLDGQNQVYLGSGLSAFDAATLPSSYVSVDYQIVSQGDITAMTVTNAQGELRFRKDEAGQWTLEGLAEGEQPNSFAISDLVSRAAAVRLTRPLGKTPRPEYGLDRPAAVVTLTVQPAGGQAQTVTLTVGAKDEADGTYVVRSSQAQYIVKTSEWSVRDFVEKARDDFVQQPTPTPEPTPALEQTPTAPASSEEPTPTPVAR